MSTRILFLILDGWGVGEYNQSNPIYSSKTPNFDSLTSYFPYCTLQASGITVGLPWKEAGSSEIGHLTLGTGSVYLQNYPKITLAIQKGTFFDNPPLNHTAKNAKEKNGRIHLVGLLSEGAQQASFEHLEALIKFFNKNELEKIFLHLFVDGQDSPPQSAGDLLYKLKDPDLRATLATIVGRSYAMDIKGDYHLKTQRAYNALIKGIGKATADPIAYLRTKYNGSSAYNDSDTEPLIIDPEGTVQDGDTVLFFNFESQGMMQLVESMTRPAFEKFPTLFRKDVLYTSLVSYGPHISIPACFEPDPIQTSLPLLLSSNEKTQLKVTEKSKELLLSYFFNGLRHEAFPEEYQKIIPPSPETILKNPLMRSKEITETILSAMDERAYDAIFANYPAPDAVGHSGNFNLATKFVAEFDQYMHFIIKKVLDSSDWTLIITADHGNLERIYNPKTGSPDTEHTGFPVPFYLVSRPFFRKKTEADIAREKSSPPKGTLEDVAPTILHLLGLPASVGMHGKSLLHEFL